MDGASLAGAIGRAGESLSVYKKGSDSIAISNFSA